ncbi:MAG: isochorismatase family protein [Methanomassiliicoccales archaeon]|nr:MAG: isochorismatase family protein [Methanomassiliicoccales archaeon]
MDEHHATEKDFDSRIREWLSTLGEGRRFFPLDLTASALLVIDMQDFFLDEKSHAYIPTSKLIVPNVQALIGAYKRNGMPVIFSRHAHKDGEDLGMMGKWWSDPMMDDDPFTKISDTMPVEDSDIVFRKTRYSVFHDTELAKSLRDKRVEKVVITGVATHLCCESTARAAFMLDFEVYFVIDGTATWEEDMHLASLKTSSDGFSVPVTTKEVLKALGG